MALKLRALGLASLFAFGLFAFLRGARADEASPWPSSATPTIDGGSMATDAAAPKGALGTLLAPSATSDAGADKPASISALPSTAPPPISDAGTASLTRPGPTPTPPPPVGASSDLPTTAIATESTLSLQRESTRARFHTLAELELGILALPFAPISPAQRGGDTFIGRIGRGDATILAGIRVLASTGKRWSVGAAARFAPKPTADSEYGGTGRLPRTHSRSYFGLGVEGRFIPLQFGDFDLWGGANLGAVVVADRFSTDSGDAVPPVLGDRNVTIATEGLTVGGQVGLHWNFSDRWVLGTALRFDNWFLPKTSSCTPIGDCTTLQGGVLALDLGLTIGYRVPL